MKNVLYVEDEYLVCLTLQKIWNTTLRIEDNLYIARSYSEAIQKFSKIKFDLVFTDITMPGSKDGIDVIKKIREMDEKVPIIVVSNFTSNINPVSDLVQEHHSKPLYPKTVKYLLDKYLQKA